MTSDCAKSLPTINVPVVAFGADSGIFRNGIAMGKAIASQMHQGRFNPFEDAGHSLFYEQLQRFNAALMDFVKALEVLTLYKRNLIPKVHFPGWQVITGLIAT